MIIQSTGGVEPTCPCCVERSIAPNTNRSTSRFLKRLIPVIAGVGMTSALMALTGCAPGGGFIDPFWEHDNLTGDEVVQLDVTSKAFTLANGYINTSRPAATGLFFEELESVMLQNGSTSVGGGDFDDKLDDPLFEDASADSCPSDTTDSSAISTVLNCRGLSYVAAGFALQSIEPMQERHTRELIETHSNELDGDGVIFVSAWNREALRSGVRSGSILAGGMMREIGLCDQGLAAEERAFRFGEEQGKALLKRTEEEVMPNAPKTQCNTDVHANTVYAQAIGKLDTERPICDGQEEASVFDAYARERYEEARREGLQQGLDDAYQLLRVKLVSSFECERPPLPLADPDAPREEEDPDDPCDCYARHHGSGPVYCFPQSTFEREPFDGEKKWWGEDLKATADGGTPQCQPNKNPNPMPIGSPLVFDLDGDGIHLTDASVVPFDLADTGERVKIPALMGTDALLALDLDGSGTIDSGAELFGNNTSCGDFGSCLDGVHAITQHDANNDGRLDASDPVFTKLLLWRDANRDGFSAPEELTPLADVVASIDLEARLDLAWADARGNSASRALNFITTRGERAVAHDVWFALSFDTLPENPRSSGVVSRWDVVTR